MPSPPASRSESATPQFAHSTQQDLVNQLRDDKDRLVSDKERLVAEKNALVNEKRLLADDRERAVKRSEEVLDSKNRLWQEYYDAVKTRDEEIVQLKRDYTALERQLAVQHKQNRRLARALSEFMEVDEVDADAEESNRSRKEPKFEDSLEAAPVPRAMKQERTSSWIETVQQPGAVMTESRKQMQEMFGGATSVIELDDCGSNGEPPAKRAKLSETAMVDCDNARADAPPPRPRSNSSVDRDAETGDQAPSQPITEQQGTALRSSAPPLVPSPGHPAHDAVPQGEDGTMEISEIARSLQDDFLTPMAFAIRPVIRHKVAIGGYGKLDQLDRRVLNSLRATMRALQQKNREGKRAKFPTKRNIMGCCWAWTHHNGDVLWTTEHPRLFACKSCFQAERACLLWQGDSVWDILPLPPKVRRQDATCSDDGYYISDQPYMLEDIGGVWWAYRKGKTTANNPLAAS